PAGDLRLPGAGAGHREPPLPRPLPSKWGGEPGPMTLFLQYIASGVATGCTFALTATGFVAVYRVTRVVNFAQGMFAVVGGLIAYSLLARGLPHGVSEAVAVLLGALVGLVVGVAAIGKPG